MRYFLLIALLVCRLAAFPQTEISGFVMDKDTQRPIPYAVVFTDDRDVFSQTGDNGAYSLTVPAGSRVHFEHLAYEKVSVVADSLNPKQTVWLIPAAIPLDEVVISPGQVEELLATAVNNLMDRMEIKRPRPYFCHNKETTSIGGDREAYALMDIGLRRIKKKARRWFWEIELVSLDLLKQENEEGFYMKKKPFRIEFLPQRRAGRKKLTDFYCEKEVREDGLLTIKITPKQPDYNYYRYQTYTIDMADTVVVEMISQSLPDTEELTKRNYRGLDWKHMNTYSFIRFGKDPFTSDYFLSEEHIIGNTQIESYCLSFLFSMKHVPATIPMERTGKKKKINPYTYILYEKNN